MKTAPQTAHTQHTPGPWLAVGNRVYHDFKIGGENASRFIASANCSDDYTPVSQQEANARLIAAAPDLLKALENAAAQFDYTVAALAKGQTVSVSSLQNCAAAARVAAAKAKTVASPAPEDLRSKLERLADGYERAADAESSDSEAEELRMKCQNIRDAIKATQ